MKKSETQEKQEEDTETQKSSVPKHEVLINTIKADGGAYKGCPKNDYCLHFVETGERPQNFIRDYEEEKRFLDYPKLNELIKLKNEVLQKRATPSMWIQCDLKKFDLSVLGKFDVIFCFLFLWVGAGEGLDKGRQLLKNWTFRRCEDIVWIKTNKRNFSKKSYEDCDNSLLQHTKEHCLVGIKGAVKRGVDGHFIHANIDTDVIVSEEPPQGSTEKPEELYRIIERFCMGRKRIELFGEDRNKRPGWLTLGNNLSNTNFNLEKYNNFFKGDLYYPDVQGYEGGRYVGCTPEIENLRPRSPTKAQNIQPVIPQMNINGQMSNIPIFPQMSFPNMMNIANLYSFQGIQGQGNIDMMNGQFGIGNSNSNLINNNGLMNNNPNIK